MLIDDVAAHAVAHEQHGGLAVEGVKNKVALDIVPINLGDFNLMVNWEQKSSSGRTLLFPSGGWATQPCSHSRIVSVIWRVGQAAWLRSWLRGGQKLTNDSDRQDFSVPFWRQASCSCLRKTRAAPSIGSGFRAYVAGNVAFLTFLYLPTGLLA